MVKLTIDELEQLKKYRLNVNKAAPKLSIECLDLLNEEKIKYFFNQMQVYIQTDHKAALGSMFIKRYAFISVIALYSLSNLNKLLNVQLNNVTIYSYEDETNNNWLPFFHLKDITVKDIRQNRNKYRDELLKTLFKNNIDRVIQTVAKCAKVSKWVLWENVAIYIFWLYETLLEDPSVVEQKERINKDFLYIVQRADGKLFGQMNQNPLSRFYRPKAYNEKYQMEIRERMTCCLYYLTNKEGNRCKSCPCVC